ncbi:MAG: ATP-binding protein [Acetobacteraceae bacterium]
MIWAIGVVVIVVTLLGCAAVIWDLHREALQQQQVAVRNLGVVLAEQTNRYVQVMDLVLREVQARVAAQDVHTADELAGIRSPGTIRNFLLERLRDLPQANAFSVVKADGRLLLTTRDGPPGDVDLSDRDYYRHLTQGDDAGPFISGPLNSRLVGRPTIYLARRIDGPGGQFLGIVLGSMDVEYLTDFYRAIDLPPGASVTLLRRDGLVLARHPDPTDQVGGRMPADSPWYATVAGEGGSYRSPGLLAPEPAIVSVHPLQVWPLVIDVSIQESLALATWRGQAAAIAVGGLGTAAGFAILFAIIAHQFRRKAEQTGRLVAIASALRASEARLMDFAEMSSDWLWEVDADLRFVWIADSKMIRQLGVHERIGRRPWESAGQDPADPKWAALRDDMLAHRSFRDFRDTRLDWDQRLRHLSINGNPVSDAQGRFMGYRGTGRDITAEVAAAEELCQAREAAEAASRMKSEFLASMSHELRTPLNAIIGFSELIHDQPFGRIGPNYVEYATDINTAGRHLLDVINDVLDLSKIEAGAYGVADEMVDLGMVARACIDMLKLRAKDGGVRIDNRLTGRRIVLLGDMRAIKQTVLNLLSNAVKFTPPGGTVSLEIEQADGLVLVVDDTGIGIDPVALQTLGQPFRQANALISRTFGGTGLGLAICRKLLALHGATLAIESEPGVGTTVRAIFPADRIIEVSPIAPVLQPAA